MSPHTINSRLTKQRHHSCCIRGLSRRDVCNHTKFHGLTNSRLARFCTNSNEFHNALAAPTTGKWQPAADQKGPRLLFSGLGEIHVKQVSARVGGANGHTRRVLGHNGNHSPLNQNIWITSWGPSLHTIIFRGPLFAAQKEPWGLRGPRHRPGAPKGGLVSKKSKLQAERTCRIHCSRIQIVAYDARYGQIRFGFERGGGKHRVSPSSGAFAKPEWGSASAPEGQPICLWCNPLCPWCAP